MVTENTCQVELSARLYFAIGARLVSSNDKRTVREVVSIAVKSWLGEFEGPDQQSSYRWRNLVLPQGSELRLRYKGGTTSLA